MSGPFVGACRDVDPEMFFGPSDSKAGAAPFEWERRALRVCDGCPVQAPCVEQALRQPAGDQYGVVGGLTASQRRKVLSAGDSEGAVARAEAAVAALRDSRQAGDMAEADRAGLWQADRDDAGDQNTAGRDALVSSGGAR